MTGMMTDEEAMRALYPGADGFPAYMAAMDRLVAVCGSEMAEAIADLGAAQLAKVEAELEDEVGKVKNRLASCVQIDMTPGR